MVLNSAAVVSANAAGQLTIIGTGTGAGTTNRGIDVETGTSLQSGRATLQGQASGGGVAVSFDASGSSLHVTGTAVLTGDRIDLGAARTISGTGASTLVIQPLTPSQNMVLGGTTDVKSALTLTTQTNLAAISPSGTTGFQSITIGRANSSGTISLATSVSFPTNLLLQTTGGLNVTLNSTPLTLNVTGVINLNSIPLNLTLQSGFVPPGGKVFTIIHTTAGVTGTFQGLPQGTTVTVSGQNYAISYQGGMGGDVTLTRT